jgi:hypothetical protein
MFGEALVAAISNLWIDKVPLGRNDHDIFGGRFPNHLFESTNYANRTVSCSHNCDVVHKYDADKLILDSISRRVH